MTQKRAVRFTKPAPPYITGDVAVFDGGRAQQLVDRRVAAFEESAQAEKADPKGTGKAGAPAGGTAGGTK